ncbi:hypothetical protein [Demequina rhizosphaerae]|uniref:hypothetical protein n=1 Tax=Demequina rhizosphaerae TaxID=1638985 RepID=UPI000780C246|nr:hypothetical protein [Demequina rhizosphaerae]
MNAGTGRLLLALSAAGPRLTEEAIRRFGVGGARVVVAVCAGLLVRDGVLIARGAPRRLRTFPATLLWLETLAAAGAVATTMPLALGPGADEDVGPEGEGRGPDRLRRAAVSTLFGLHTARFRIYLQPDQGLREDA